MDKPGFIELLDKYITHSITQEERGRLSALLQDETHKTELENLIDQQLAGNTFEIKEDEGLRQLLFERIQQARKNKTAPVRSLFWRRIAVAASVILLFATGYWLLVDRKSKPTEIVKTPQVPADVKAPETNRAMITLANGEKVYLDSALNGQLAMQGDVKLVKLANGQITYESTLSHAQGDIQYNTLHNPRGSKVIDMKLSDGSRVWLNAGSSVTFPIAFVSNERKVTLEGEAYFEIARNPVKPFKVRAGIQEVEVLGTHFNINAYPDEDAIRTTLLEGSVRVKSTVGSHESVILKPGQQGQSLANDIKIVNVDITQVMAWKNGWFEFEQMDLVTIMRQVSRWYNLDIVYKGTPGNAKFGGRINKELPLSKVLGSLEANGNGIQFRLEGNKLIVQP